MPFVVGINGFDGVYTHTTEDIREALTIGAHVPIVTCDARNRESTKATLITLVEHALSMRGRGVPINH